MKEEKEGQEKTGWWRRGEAEKGAWHELCATVSVFCKLPLILEPKGEAPEAAGACNSGGKAYPRPSGEPVATSRQQGARHSWDAVLGTPNEDLAFPCPVLKAYDVLQGRGEEVYAQTSQQKVSDKATIHICYRMSPSKAPHTMLLSWAGPGVLYMSRTVRGPRAIRANTS